MSKKLTEKAYRKVFMEYFTKSAFEGLYIHEDSSVSEAYPLEEYIEDFYQSYDSEFDEKDVVVDDEGEIGVVDAEEHIGRGFNFLHRVRKNKDGEWEEY